MKIYVNISDSLYFPIEILIFIQEGYSMAQNFATKRSKTTPAARNPIKNRFWSIFRFISVRNFIENRYILYIPIEFPGIQ